MALAEVDQRMELGAVHYAINRLRRPSEFGMQDLAGGIILFRSERLRAVKDPWIEGNDRPGIAGAARAGKTGEVRRFRVPV